MKSDSLHLDRYHSANLYQLNSEQLNRLPKRSIESKIDALPGAVFRDGHLHLFGARSQESAYLVNGANISHRIRGASSIHIIPEALQRMSVSPLPYDASFGGATGGVLSATLREGGDRWSSSLHYRSDAFNSQDKALLGSYGFGEQNTVATLGGPLGKYFRFFGAVEYQHLNDPSKQVFEAATFKGLENRLIPSMPEFVDVVLPQGSRENYDNSFLALNNNITMTTKNLDGELQFGLTTRRTNINTMPLLNSFNDRQMDEKNDSWYVATKLEYKTSSKSTIGVRYNMVQSSYARFDEVFEDDYIAWFDSSRNAAEGIQFERSISPQLPLIIREIWFRGSGSPLSETFVKTEQVKQNLLLDLNYLFINKKNRRLEGRLGLDYQRESSRFFSINGRSVLALLNQLPDADFPEDIRPETLVIEADVATFGYSRLGSKEDITGPSSPITPTILAPYGEITFSNELISATAGIRFANYQTDTYRWTEPTLGYLDPETGLLLEQAFSPNDTHQELLPRISFIGKPYEHMQINAGLGWFLQHTKGYFGGNTLASFQRNRQWSVGATIKYPTLGTIDIQLIDKALTLALAGVPEIETKSSNTHMLLRYATPIKKGFKLSTGYTYQTGDPASETHRQPYNPLLEYKPPTIFPTTSFFSTSFFNPKHDAELSLGYASRSKSAWRDGFQVVLQSEITSGVSYTPVSVGRIPDYFFAGLDGLGGVFPDRVDYNKFRTPVTWQLNAALSKAFRFHGNRSVSIGVDFINILNRKNTINVYPLTGNAESIGIESNQSFIEVANAIEGGEPELFNALNTNNGESFRVATGKELYDTPRQILIKVGIEL